MRGGAGDDTYLFGGKLGPFTDAADDVVRGGRGGDNVNGGYGQGGVDRLFGEEGNDVMNAVQRDAETGEPPPGLS